MNFLEKKEGSFINSDEFSQIEGMLFSSFVD